MRWRFHRERERRYQIAIEELQTIFNRERGFDLFFKLGKAQKQNLSRSQRQLIESYKRFVLILCREERRHAHHHKKICSHLRELLIQMRSLEIKETWQKELARLLGELCLTKYHRTHFYSFGSDLLTRLFSALTLSGEPFDLQSHFSNYNFLEEAELLESSNPLVYLDRDVRKFDENLIKRRFDSHRYNLPHLLYTFAFFRSKRVVKIKMVRMGCPTQESWFRPPKVVEEFRGFLDCLKRQNKAHLYINKQKTWGDEGRRSDKLHELDQEVDNLHVVSLPSDGDFYLQKGRFSQVNQMNIFKPLFIRMLRGKINSGYYYVPKAWSDDPQFTLGLTDVIDKVHALHFENKDQLTQKERHLFVDIAYTHLILFFLNYAEVSSVNITCRDGIDRAGCEQSKLLYYFQISLGIDEELESRKERQFTQHIPVYFAKMRAIVPERREILHEVLKAYSPKVREEIRLSHQSDPILFARPHFVKRDKFIRRA